MTYLGYEWQDGQPGRAVAVKTTDINAKSLFTQTGTCFALTGIEASFNVVVFGAPISGNRVNFQPIPMFQAGWDAAPPGETGLIVPQPNGMIAIQWPL
jgi:hypothetical protein